MRAFFAAAALLPEGWARDVRLEVEDDGTLAAAAPNAAAAGAERLAGPVLPGLCDLHCHAFQRALAGLTERRNADGDSFWTWRELMYRFAARITPDNLEAIAAQLYVELLAGGFTAVCEFHYLHHDRDGRQFADPAEMALRLVRAAGRAGIGLTILPVLYQTADFGGAPPRAAQRRFVVTVDALLAIVTRLRAASADSAEVRVGIAPHSLRAVPPVALREAIAGLDAIDAAAPIHVHVAEQTKEVDDCRAWSGRRPVEWLLERHAVSSRWCLVHAIHMSGPETAALARSGTVAGLCPTTEANLGDGLFPLAEYLAQGGAFGVGTDSNVGTAAAAELRLLEYGQRLANRRRGVAAAAAIPSPGLALYVGALAGGARAAGRPIAGLQPGQRADFVVLDDTDPWLAGHGPDTLLDALVFGGSVRAVRDVFVGGRQVIAGGRHGHEGEIASAYREAVARLIAVA